MLQIRIGSSYFDIPNDIQIPISVMNPLVSESAFNEIYTYSFTLQASPKNKSLYTKYVNKEAKISITFQSHILTTGIAIMNMDSSGISIMIKNDAANLRQSLENTQFDSLDLPIISVCNEEDHPGLKINKWVTFMNSKLPQNEDWDKGMFKFPPIYAAPQLEWAVNEDTSGFELNPTMYENGFPLNDYDLLTGEYINNYGIPMVQKSSFILIFRNMSINPSDFFLFASANNTHKYVCWYSVDGIGTDPLPASTRIKIEVPILTSDNDIQISNKTAIAISAYNLDFEVNNYSNGNIQVNNKIVGPNDIASNANVFGLTIQTINPYIVEEGKDGNNWRTGMTACLRIQYLINQIAEYFQVKLDDSFLNQIPEYKSLINYVGKAQDIRENVNNFQYNTFGTELNLNDFKPNTALIDVFKLINHLFGVVFNFVNSKLVVEPVKLNLMPMNISKFCMPEYKITELENKTIEYTYNLGQDAWKYGTYRVNNIRYSNYNDYKIGLGKSEQIEIPFMVLIDYKNKATSFQWPLLPKSLVYNPEDYESDSELQVGLFRGNFNVEYSIPNPYPDPPTILTENRMICINSNSIIYHSWSEFSEEVNYANKFGRCSIYANSNINPEDSYLTVYSNFMNALKLYNQEIEKNLNLPFQKIIEIMKWKQPIHTIQQRNMSFSGIVKDVKFTIGKNTISPTTITYLVNKKIETGDFNDDFNEDFNN